MIEQERPIAITAIAIYHFIAGGFLIISSLLSLAIVMIPIQIFLTNPLWQFLGFVGLGFYFVVPLILGVWMLFTGKGLLAMREWARWSALILAIFAFAGVPVGTVIGILILYSLLQEDSKKLFVDSDVL